MVRAAGWREAGRRGGLGAPRLLPLRRRARGRRGGEVEAALAPRQTAGCGREGRTSSWQGGRASLESRCFLGGKEGPALPRAGSEACPERECFQAFLVPGRPLRGALSVALLCDLEKSLHRTRFSLPPSSEVLSPFPKPERSRRGLGTSQLLHPFIPSADFECFLCTMPCARHWGLSCRRLDLAGIVKT